MVSVSDPHAPVTGPRSADAQAGILRRAPQSVFDIVDAHTHLGSDAVMFMPRHAARDVVAAMDRCGVGMAVSSSMRAIRQDVVLGNRETAAAVDSLNGRIRGAMVINPWRAPDDEIAFWAADPRMSMIKVHPDVHEYPLSGARYDAVWEFATRTGCPVLTHTWHGSEFDGWPQVERVCDRFPGVPLIAGHAGVLSRGLDIGIQLTATFPRLLLELCGSHSHGREITRMVREAGADRVLYGSDSPFIEMRTALGRAIFCDLTDDERERVLGRNVRELLRWREGGRLTAGAS